MPVYTVSPLSSLQVTSQVFKDHGIRNGAPTRVSESRVFVIPGMICLPLQIALLALWAYAASFLLKIKIDIPTCVNALKTKRDDIYQLFPLPPLCISVSDKSESTQSKLRAAGFVQKVSNRYVYYEGPATDAGIQVAVQCGANINCYTPYGTVNISGVLCLSAIHKLFHAALGYISDRPDTFSASDEVDESEGKSWINPYITTKSAMPNTGVFFPYFDGLVLPDKAILPKFIASTFFGALGDSKKDRVNSIQTITSGWSSLSTTSSGTAISHLTLGMQFAIQSNTSIKVVLLAGRYRGFVLYKTDFAVIDGQTRILPYPKDQLMEEYDALDKHTKALEEIAGILCGEVPDSKEDPDTVVPAQISSPRKLHYILSRYSLNTTLTNAIRIAANNLSFEQSFWSSTDAAKVALATSHIVEKKWLEDNAPFAYKHAQALFSKDPTFSTLAAFGEIVPTLSGSAETSNAAVTIPKTGNPYKDFKPCSIRGVPVFAKPLQQGYEDWKDLLRSRVIKFKHDGNDRNGRAKLSGIRTLIHQDTDEAKSLVRSLRLLAESSKKRTRDSDDTDTRGDSVKKSRIQGGNTEEGQREAEEALGLFGGLALPPGEAGPANVAPMDDSW